MLEENFSPALQVVLSKWGDVVGVCYSSADPRCVVHQNLYRDCCSPPNNSVDFVDISAAVDKFTNKLGAPAKVRIDIAPNLPNKIVDFVDIPNIVDAFRGLVYPYMPPFVDPCP